MAPAASIQHQFRDSILLLTGATGYVGGLVLEALLRTTQVQKVYVVLRSKAGESPSDRLAGLLQVCQLPCSCTSYRSLGQAQPRRGLIIDPGYVGCSMTLSLA